MKHLVVALVLAACSSPRQSPADDAPPAPDGPPDAAMASDPFAAFAAMPPVCSSDNWCWWEPTPSGEYYNRIVSSSPDNIWIVGGGPPSYAAILQWNGQAWIAHKPPVKPGYPEYQFPMAISTAGPDNTWMVYGNLVERYDGTSWNIMDENTASLVTLNGVWVDPSGDAWVTQSDGVIKRWHGDTPTVMAAGVYAGSIWGTAPDDVFFTTIGGVYHYAGTSFAPVYTGGKTAGWYQGVKDDVWISGGDGAILHWDGTAITEMSGAVPSSATVQSADYAKFNDVSWVAGSAAPSKLIHWDGTQFTTTAIETAYTPIGDNACTSLGSVRVIDGKWWIVCSSGVVATKSGPSTLELITGPWDANGTMWGTSKTNLYLAPGGDLRHFDGTTWTRIAKPMAIVRGRAGAGIDGADELFGAHRTNVAGQDTGYFDHFDGATWTAIPVVTSKVPDPIRFISSVYPLGPDEAMIVGGAGLAFHYQSGALTPIAPGTTVDLAGIWGPDADHLWITGGNGTLLQWDRANPGVFTRDPTFPTTTDNLRDIANTGGATWILAENEPYVWRKLAGGDWQTVATSVIPMSMAAISDANVVVSSTTSGWAARWNGTTFAIESYPSWRGLQNVFALPDGTTYLAGSSGIIVHP